MDGYKIALVIISHVNIVLHAAGLYLLWSLGKRGQGNWAMSTNQNILLQSLSIAEILINFMNIFYLFFDILRASCLAGIFYAAVINYYLNMAYLTLDRFFEVYWNIKYPVYWPHNNSKYLCIVTGIMVVVTGTISILLDYYKVFDSIYIYFRYIFPAMDAVYLLLAMITYVYIYIKFMKVGHTNRSLSRRSNNSVSIKQYQRSTDSSEQPCTCNNNNGPCRRGQFHSRWSTFLQSRFLVATFIILTFVLCVVTPDIILAIRYNEYKVSHPEHATKETFIIAILYFLSFTCDAFIYTLLHPDIRTLLKVKIFRKYSTRQQRCQYL